MEATYVEKGFVFSLPLRQRVSSAVLEGNAKLVFLKLSHMWCFLSRVNHPHQDLLSRSRYVYLQTKFIYLKIRFILKFSNVKDVFYN